MMSRPLDPNVTGQSLQAHELVEATKGTHWCQTWKEIATTLMQINPGIKPCKTKMTITNYYPAIEKITQEQIGEMLLLNGTLTEDPDCVHGK